MLPMNLMAQIAPLALSGWSGFYEIVGCSAGTLIGLQFVVITLIASVRRTADAQAINAFGTPTLVHFGAVLALSAILCAPWNSRAALATTVICCGVFGLAYTGVALRRTVRQKEYKPVMEDWIWFLVLPAASYGMLTIGACILLASPTASASFIFAGAVLGLLLIATHNAWDSVTHIVAIASENQQKDSP